MLVARCSLLLERLRTALGSRAFEALYGALAPYYDGISRFFFAGEWATWRRCALAYVAGPRVLELGYGTGELAVELARRGYETWGVDASPRMLLLARRKLARREARATLLLGSAQTLPFGAGGFDTVVSTFPSTYIADLRTWAEVSRVLRPGGRFVIVVGGRLLPVDRRSAYLIRFHRLVYGSFGSGGGEWRPQAPGFQIENRRCADARGVASLLVAERVVAGGDPD